VLRQGDHKRATLKSRLAALAAESGAMLTGPGVIAGKTWRVSLVRTAPAAKAD